MSARDEVLLRGLIDWVALERIHSIVAEENAGQPLSVIQDTVLELIRSLVSDGLYVVGELNESSRFEAWDTPLAESIQRIRDVYTTNFDDDAEWWFYSWLAITEKGWQVAEDIESRRQSEHTQLTEPASSCCTNKRLVDDVGEVSDVVA
ncbi:hypothetical protein [Mycobacterium sp.]|uniref:hypothetical protein n=1 Tax=Mycobacterium sp. TaxID=1785 RepID=UPI003D6AFAFD